MKTPINSKRLIIRPLFIGDLHAVLAITGAPDIYHYIPEKPMNEQDIRNMIERGQNHPECDDVPVDVAVELIETNELVGLLSFCTISNRFRAVEVGWMVHKGYRGNGYTSEAARALITYGFLTLGLHRIIASCDPLNMPSARIMENLGMDREAELVGSVVLSDGEWHNEYFYTITEKEWGKRSDQEGING
ncbi:MAG: GNAT family N-acetyltransferase [Anaerolineaceae bacterium]